MTCRCGSSMNRQSEGVFFCSKGDKFVVVTWQKSKLGVHVQAKQQWYSKDI